MTVLNADQAVHTLEFKHDELIEAPIEIVWQAVLDELGPDQVMPDGKSMSMKLEAFPGGRWFRDLGNNTGHLWGHVQVIKPPALLEISGPMFMAYPGVNFMQYRLKAEGSGTRLKLFHQAMGLIPQEHRDGMDEGWKHFIDGIRQLAMKAVAKKGGK